MPGAEGVVGERVQLDLAEEGEGGVLGVGRGGRLGDAPWPPRGRSGEGHSVTDSRSDGLYQGLYVSLYLLQADLPNADILMLWSLKRLAPSAIES